MAINILSDAVHVALGAGAALAGGLIQATFNERRERIRLRASKLERSYQLCQAVYDGHKREILKAHHLLPNNAAKFKDVRQHPGAEMSELKFLLRAYSPGVLDSLERLDKAHRPLKDSFATIDDLIATEGSLSEEAFAALSASWKQNLKDLGIACQELKIKIATLVGGLVR
ncbi:MAG: hypothetical protein KGI42_16600 [Xanthomonadaceae bacterium]|nr:hypothetical protein [Xanthomonadaceae bacterium]